MMWDRISQRAPLRLSLDTDAKWAFANILRDAPFGAPQDEDWNVLKYRKTTDLALSPAKQDEVFFCSSTYSEPHPEERRTARLEGCSQTVDPT
jgi:hypothetical protein